MATAKRAKKAKKAASGKQGAAAKKVATPKKASAAKRRAPRKTVATPAVSTTPAASILDHVILPVRDYARSKAFYTAALAPLGVELVMEWATFGGFGADKKPAFWVGE